MLALVLSMLFCVAIGSGVVGYVMLEARREGRGEFWTPEGEELIAGARRTTEKVRARSGELVGTAAEKTRRVVRDKVYAEPTEPAEDEPSEVRRAS
ncbi:hypothetical protein [Ornithinimicrobium tianjinense]|uniref:Uncharacterized protein n=1 Tax=Ornithinimicrobium tianjinense TaxID=1195761 RepID=A0A917F5K8_9MICO|nr:hypothetical protein [Ornithinimicrobium tianjinense]GGF50345.1 hypothetical protein GCM10011366_17770 [Ornithinimicrobium tianjinense]